MVNAKTEQQTNAGHVRLNSMNIDSLEVSDLVMLRAVGQKTIHGEVTKITDNTITIEDEDYLVHVIEKPSIHQLSIGW